MKRIFLIFLCLTLLGTLCACRVRLIADPAQADTILQAQQEAQPPQEEEPQPPAQEEPEPPEQMSTMTARTTAAAMMINTALLLLSFDFVTGHPLPFQYI